MNIPKEYLAESNYEGSRLIEITDEKVIELQKELTELQKKANPHLDEMGKLTGKLDEIYTRLRALENEKKSVQDELVEYRTSSGYDEHLKAVESIDQHEAQPIKNKIQAIVNTFIEGKLGEFEKAVHLKEMGGKLFIEVVDEVEEKVKAVRATKQTKK